MSEQACDLTLKQLYDAFSGYEKPVPMATYAGSYCDEEIDVFNSLDWEEVTYSDLALGFEGVIICKAPTKVYLLPRLFKMVMLRRSGTSEGAVDNVAIHLETWPVEEEVEALLGKAQKRGIIAAWAYLDAYLYSPSGSHVARELAKHWKL